MVRRCAGNSHQHTKRTTITCSKVRQTIFSTYAKYYLTNELYNAPDIPLLQRESTRQRESTLQSRGLCETDLRSTCRLRWSARESRRNYIWKDNYASISTMHEIPMLLLKVTAGCNIWTKMQISDSSSSGLERDILITGMKCRNRGKIFLIIKSSFWIHLSLWWGHRSYSNLRRLKMEGRRQLNRWRGWWERWLR